MEGFEIGWSLGVDSGLGWLTAVGFQVEGATVVEGGLDEFAFGTRLND